MDSRIVISRGLRLERGYYVLSTTVAVCIANAVLAMEVFLEPPGTSGAWSKQVKYLGCGECVVQI